HRALPILPVLVGNQQRNRPTRRDAVTNAAEHLSAIGFNRHSTAASVARLPPAQLRGHGVEIDRQARRHAFENRDERLSVRFSRGEKTQHPRSFYPKNLHAPGVGPHAGEADLEGRNLAPWMRWLP